ncbi:MAG: hypothetical protein R3B49_06455 [Phycisphaerales bacterium]
MSDPGLAIGPTHRVLGGMKDYTVDKFIEAAGGYLNIEAVDNDPKKRTSRSRTWRGCESATCSGFTLPDGAVLRGVGGEPGPVGGRLPGTSRSSGARSTSRWCST